MKDKLSAASRKLVMLIAEGEGLSAEQRALLAGMHAAVSWALGRPSGKAMEDLVKGMKPDVPLALSKALSSFQRLVKREGSLLVWDNERQAE